MKKEYMAPEITVTPVDYDIITGSFEDTLAWWGPTITMEEE
ncbi:MAG: hypothetical protein ACI3X1_06250 [Eubacteriales bacterium]